MPRSADTRADIFIAFQSFSFGFSFSSFSYAASIFFIDTPLAWLPQEASPQILPCHCRVFLHWLAAASLSASRISLQIIFHIIFSDTSSSVFCFSLYFLLSLVSYTLLFIRLLPFRYCLIVISFSHCHWLYDITPYFRFHY